MSSSWFSDPTNSNKLRQSYLKGFLDISGGGVLVRADNSLNFYTTASPSAPKFGLDATKLTVVDASTGEMRDIATTRLSYLHDLSENIMSAFRDIRSHFEATGSATTTSAIEVANDAMIGGKLRVVGNAQFDSEVSISGNLNLAQDLHAKGNGYFGGNLEVAGSQIINMNLYVKGDSYLQGRVFVTMDASFHSNVGVYGNVSCAGHIIANQDLSANGNLRVAGTTTLKSKATITAGGLEATGDVTLHNKLTVDGDAKISSNAAITGNMDISGNSYVLGNAGVHGTFDVSAATALHSTLTVTDKTILLADLSLNGNLVMANTKTFTTGNLNLTDSDNNNPSYIWASVGDLTLDTTDPTKAVRIKTNLIVDGSFSFTGTVTQTNVNLQISDELDISANGATALKVRQNAGMDYNIAEFSNSIQAAPVFIVGTNNTVAINKTAASSNYAFDVSGASQFSGKMFLKSILDVSGISNFTGKMKLYDELDVDNKITARSDVQLTTGKFTVSSGDTEIQKLKVNSTSEFVEKLTLGPNAHIEQW